jgi:hypothetical protein
VTNQDIDFKAFASLRKWPSIHGRRNPNVEFLSPYLLLDGTLDDCIKEFMSKPAATHQLYQIHTNLSRRW